MKSKRKSTQKTCPASLRYLSAFFAHHFNIKKEFNQFEVDRINFIKEKLKQVSNELLEFPSAFDKAGSHIAQTTDAVF
jgi:hypothetical protein